MTTFTLHYHIKQHPTTRLCKVMETKVNKKTKEIIKCCTKYKDKTLSEAESIIFQLERKRKLQ